MFIAVGPRRASASPWAIEPHGPGAHNEAEAWTLDIASYDSVKAFAKRAAAELDRIDVVLANASAALDRWSESEGLETSVAGRPRRTRPDNPPCCCPCPLAHTLMQRL